jgi:hypothetical protein
MTTPTPVVLVAGFCLGWLLGVVTMLVLRVVS